MHPLLILIKPYCYFLLGLGKYWWIFSFVAVCEDDLEDKFDAGLFVIGDR